MLVSLTPPIVVVVVVTTMCCGFRVRWRLGRVRARRRAVAPAARATRAVVFDGDIRAHASRHAPLALRRPSEVVRVKS